MLVNSVLLSTFLSNATRGANPMSLGDRILTASGATPNPATGSYALAKPSDCTFSTSTAAFPSAGASCTTEGNGAVVWSIDLFLADDVNTDWILYCTGGVWTSYGSEQRSLSEWNTRGNPQIRINTDNARDGTTESPTAWEEGSITGHAGGVNFRCDDPAPSGWQWGGSLYICLDEMETNNAYSGIICSQGDTAYDTPTCATSGIPLCDFNSCTVNPNPAMLSLMDDE